MTREEAINRLLDMGNEIRAYCDNAKHMSEDDRKTMKTYDLAIKALKQKSVLDEVRAEIEKLQTYKMFIGEKTVYVERDDVLAIIDKHRGESEGK
jgi:hypothetical protein